MRYILSSVGISNLKCHHHALRFLRNRRLERWHNNQVCGFGRFPDELKSRNPKPHAYSIVLSEPQGFGFARGFFGSFLCPDKERNIIAAFHCSVFTFFLFLNSCSLPSSNDLIVSSLRSSPSAFDSFRTNTEIRYTLAKPATVTLYIAQRDASGQLVLVNTLAKDIYETKGSHGHTWLGDTAAGLFAESGLYIAILQIESNQYETSVRVFHF